MELTELEVDATIELLNNGVGRAADSLSKMLGEEVLITVPEFELVDFEIFERQLRAFPSQNIKMLVQHFAGEFDGVGLWILPDEVTRQLTHKVLSKTQIDPTTEGIEDELFIEVGNILLNACVGQLAELIETPLSCQVPQIKPSRTSDLLSVIKSEVDQFSQQQTILMLHVNFSVKSFSLVSIVALVLDELAQEELAQKVKTFLIHLLQRFKS